MADYIITPNKQFNSLEISFEVKPSEEIREVLKGFKFRWNPKKSIWYGFADQEELQKALSSGKSTTSTKKEKKVDFDFDVKVGDIFYSSWGYEQTNVDFFQVIELVGKKSVRVREVHPTMTSENPTCSMAADRAYKVTNEILPPASSSVFIKDQEKGDLKRIKSYAADGKSNPIFDISSFASASKYNGQEVYESWYY